MHKCLIIDDEKLARELIESHLSKLDHFEVVASCSSAIEAINILNAEAVDLLFLDVEMPVLLGTDFYKNLIQRPKVIFTTAYREYAVDGFDLNAVDYLVKPITFGRFLQGIEKYLATQQNGKVESVKQAPEMKDYIFVTEDRKQIKILLSEILFVESAKNHIKIKTQRKSHLIKYSISSFEGVLDNRFVRVHRSFIVNRDKVTAYTKHDVEIGTVEIPISDSYKDVFL